MHLAPIDHTFMICAYQENPYLENCILSILRQTILGSVKISTSTPNSYIQGLAQKYNLPLVVNFGTGTMVDNLNFAYSQADTRLVTLCHQDDYYDPLYLERVLATANRGQEPIIIYTDYYEDRCGKRVESNLLLKIKRILNYPLRFKNMWSIRWLRRRLLSLGCPICCPAVTFYKPKIPGFPFTEQYKNNMDWDAWIRLSSVEGDFIYCPDRVMAHRIWESSTTTKTIANGLREREDYEILCSLWPRPLAKVVFAIYRHSQNSNT